MTHPTRREALGVLTAAAAAGVLPLRPEELHAAWSHLAGLRQSGQAYRPRFFQPDEWATLQVLVDMILPADERSGSATEAGVPPFIDFVLAEGTDESARTQVRDGLAWLDAQTQRGGGRTFRGSSEDVRSAVLDRIAWPARAAAADAEGVRFFNRLRDLTASGFWSSRTGVEDLQYMGNVMIPQWTGCPPEQLRKIGLEP